MIAVTKQIAPGTKNIELVKFLSRFLKKDVKIIRGFKSREKLLRISLKK